LASITGVIVGNRACAGIPAASDVARRNPLLNEVVEDGSGALLTKALVQFVGARAVGVAFYLKG
jgi:hypothetical protein